MRVDDDVLVEVRMGVGPVGFSAEHQDRLGERWRGGESIRAIVRKADLSVLTQDDVDAIAAKLNHRPRWVLGWATSAEAFGLLEAGRLHGGGVGDAQQDGHQM